MKVKSESEVAQSCLTLCDPMDCSLPGSSVHGICQARGLEWGAIAFSKNIYYPAFMNKFADPWPRFRWYEDDANTSELCSPRIPGLSIDLGSLMT